MTGRPAADPFTLQVVQSYLTSTVREMMRTTKASAHSVVFAEGEDFTCAITAPDGRLTFQAEGLGLHAATFPAAIRLVLEHYDSFEPGDVFFHNDPYRGGAHQADGAFARPVFHGEQLVAWVANRGHWSDVGGMSAGGWAGSATHVLQEALLVPPVRLWKGGVLDDELRRFVLANVRNPDDAWGTIQSQISSLETAEERIRTIVDRYGLATFELATESYLSYARKRFLSALQALPDGVWSAGGLPRRRRRGQRAAADRRDRLQARRPRLRRLRRDRAPGARAGEHELRQHAERGARGPARGRRPRPAAQLRVVRPRRGDRAARNARQPRVPGADVPRHGRADAADLRPRPARARAGGPRARRAAASYGTGTVVVLYFVDPQTGDERSWMHYTAGGGGARASRDGLDGVWWTLANCKLDSVEIVEQRFPLLLEREGWQRPSAGPGRQRGGLGIERRLLLLDDARASALNDRHKLPPWGLFGGGDGEPCSQRVRRGTREGSFDELFGVGSPSKFANVQLERGDRLVLRSGGGGGYGPPLDHEPDAVVRDVVEGYLDADEAERLYAVVVRGDPGELDAAATADVRAARGR